jgi:hypothetical protein
MNDRGLLDRIVAHLALGIALVVVPAAASAVGPPFDIDDTTPRDVVMDIEDSADPSIVGTDAGAVFPETATTQLVGSWTSDGTTGTIAITTAEMEAFIQAVLDDAAPGTSVDPGTWNSIFTLDIATGDGDLFAAGGVDLDGIPPIDSLSFHTNTTGGPYLPLSVAGSAAGYEIDSIAPTALIFCTDIVTFFGSPGGCGTFSDGGPMPFGPPGFAIVPAYPYIDASGLINMTGTSFASTSSVPLWNGGGDMRLTEVPEPGALAMLVSGAALLLVLKRHRLAA